jgi:hypothetical protein
MEMGYDDGFYRTNTCALCLTLLCMFAEYIMVASWLSFLVKCIVMTDFDSVSLLAGTLPFHINYVI